MSAPQNTARETSAPVENSYAGADNAASAFGPTASTAVRSWGIQVGRFSWRDDNQTAKAKSGTRAIDQAPNPNKSTSPTAIPAATTPRRIIPSVPWSRVAG